MTVVACAALVFALNRRKLRTPNQYRPKDGDHTDHQIRLDDAERLGLPISLIEPLSLAGRDLLGAQLDAREDEYRSNQNASDRSHRVKRLRKIQPPLGCIRIAQLRDERIRGCLQK